MIKYKACHDYDVPKILKKNKYLFTFLEVDKIILFYGRICAFATWRKANGSMRHTITLMYDTVKYTTNKALRKKNQKVHLRVKKGLIEYTKHKRINGKRTSRKSKMEFSRFYDFWLKRMKFKIDSDWDPEIDYDQKYYDENDDTSDDITGFKSYDDETDDESDDESDENFTHTFDSYNLTHTCMCCKKKIFDK